MKLVLFILFSFPLVYSKEVCFGMGFDPNTTVRSGDLRYSGMYFRGNVTNAKELLGVKFYQDSEAVWDDNGNLDVGFVGDSRCNSTKREVPCDRMKFAAGVDGGSLFLGLLKPWPVPIRIQPWMVLYEGTNTFWSHNISQYDSVYPFNVFPMYSTFLDFYSKFYSLMSTYSLITQLEDPVKFPNGYYAYRCLGTVLFLTTGYCPIVDRQGTKPGTRDNQNVYLKITVLTDGYIINVNGAFCWTKYAWCFSGPKVLKRLDVYASYAPVRNHTFQAFGGGHSGLLFPTSVPNFFGPWFGGIKHHRMVDLTVDLNDTYDYVPPYDYYGSLGAAPCYIQFYDLEVIFYSNGTVTSTRPDDSRDPLTKVLYLEGHIHFSVVSYVDNNNVDWSLFSALGDTNGTISIRDYPYVSAYSFGVYQIKAVSPNCVDGHYKVSVHRDTVAPFVSLVVSDPQFTSTVREAQIRSCDLLSFCKFHDTPHDLHTVDFVHIGGARKTPGVFGVYPLDGVDPAHGSKRLISFWHDKLDYLPSCLTNSSVPLRHSDRVAVPGYFQAVKTPSCLGVTTQDIALKEIHQPPLRLVGPPDVTDQVVSATLRGVHFGFCNILCFGDDTASKKDFDNLNKEIKADMDVIFPELHRLGDAIRELEIWTQQAAYDINSLQQQISDLADYVNALNRGLEYQIFEIGNQLEDTIKQVTINEVNVRLLMLYKGSQEFWKNAAIANHWPISQDNCVNVPDDFNFTTLAPFTHVTIPPLTGLTTLAPFTGTPAPAPEFIGTTGGIFTIIGIAAGLVIVAIIGFCVWKKCIKASPEVQAARMMKTQMHLQQAKSA
jgi:hypothetical protein